MHTVICVGRSWSEYWNKVYMHNHFSLTTGNSLFKNLNSALNLGVLMASILMEDLKSSWSIWYNNCTCICLCGKCTNELNVIVEQAETR